MMTNKEVRQVLNYLAKKKYKKTYSSLTPSKQMLIRKLAVKLK